MELPDTCPVCRRQTMVDWGNLEIRPISSLYTIYGYSCQHCGCWKSCWYSSRQLDGNIQRLLEMSPTHPSFRYHFVKTVRRAQQIQKRGRIADGACQYQNVATP